MKHLGEPIDQWSTLLNFIVTIKLDLETRNRWEAYGVKRYSVKAHIVANIVINVITLQFISITSTQPQDMNRKQRNQDLQTLKMLLVQPAQTIV